MRITSTTFPTACGGFTRRGIIAAVPKAPWQQRSFSVSRPLSVAVDSDDTTSATGEHAGESTSGTGAAARSDADERQRIHFLGVGNVGSFVAHSLASMPHPPKITLMLHEPKYYQIFESIGRRLILQRHGLSEHRSDYDVNFFLHSTWYNAVRKLNPETPAGGDSSSTAAAAAAGGGGGTTAGTGVGEGNADFKPGKDGRPPSPNVSVTEDNSPIDHLVVAAKATNVKRAIASLRHRLHHESTIVFLHNGMGVLDDVDREVFPDPATRPSYIAGIVSHGLYHFKYFNVVHKGVGTTTLGVVYSNPHAAAHGSDASDILSPKKKKKKDENKENTAPTYNSNNDDPSTDSKPNPSDLSHSPMTDEASIFELRRREEEARQPLAPTTSYLLRTFARSPTLMPFVTNKTDLQLFQLEKLAINALINPLAVLNDCTNGHLVDNDKIQRVQRLLLYEISGVIAALPELRSVPGIRARFAPNRLMQLTEQVARTTATNTCSMLQDVTRGRVTEVNYINGYIVRRGQELGITCALNFMLMNLVKGKRQLMEQRDEAHVPMEGGVGGSELRPGD